MAIAAPPTTHSVCHTEIVADDVKKLTTFYSAVFDWKFEAPPFMDTYFMADTGEQTSIAIQPKQDGAMSVNYIAVDDVKVFQEKIKTAGGKLLSAFSVPGNGHGVLALDPEGNPIAIWQRDPSAQMAHQVF